MANNRDFAPPFRRVGAVRHGCGRHIADFGLQSMNRTKIHDFLRRSGTMAKNPFIGLREHLAQLQQGVHPKLEWHLYVMSLAYIADVGKVLDRYATHVLGFVRHRSEEHTSELQSLMRISY